MEEAGGGDTVYNVINPIIITSDVDAFMQNNYTVLPVELHPQINGVSYMSYSGNSQNKTVVVQGQLNGGRIEFEWIVTLARDERYWLERANPNEEYTRHYYGDFVNGNGKRYVKVVLPRFTFISADGTVKRYSRTRTPDDDELDLGYELLGSLRASQNSFYPTPIDDNIERFGTNVLYALVGKPTDPDPTDEEIWAGFAFNENPYRWYTRWYADIPVITEGIIEPSNSYPYGELGVEMGAYTYFYYGNAQPSLAPYSGQRGVYTVIYDEGSDEHSYQNPPWRLPFASQAEYTAAKAILSDEVRIT